MTSPDAPMEPADHGGGGAALLAVTAAPSPAPALSRQLSYTCSRGRCEPMHDCKLSHSYSFSSAAASLSSPASSTSSRSYHVAMSNKSSSCESIPVVLAELEKQSSFSSASSYESLFRLEATDRNRISAATAATTQAPAVQMMTATQGEQLAVAGSGWYDPRRLPSSMFRTGSTSPTDMVEWSVTSNDSLFSINLPHSGDLSARYNNHSGDLFYDAAGGGFHRVTSAGHDASSWRLSSVSERLSTAAAGAGGGLCVSDSCARCSTAGNNRKSVRFASAAGIVSGEISRNSAVFSTLADALGEAGAAPATEGKETKAPGAAAQGGWCLFRCCLPSPPLVWWPRCGCGRGGCGVFCCGEYCQC